MTLLTPSADPTDPGGRMSSLLAEVWGSECEAEALRRTVEATAGALGAERCAVMSDTGPMIERGFGGAAGSALAVLLIDLDRFKQVNERLGHAAGDDVLRQVARTLRDTVRNQDTAARQGGDEFAVLAPDTDADGAAMLAERLRQRLRRLQFAGEPIDATIGWAVYPARRRQRRRAARPRRRAPAGDQARRRPPVAGARLIRAGTRPRAARAARRRGR